MNLLKKIYTYCDENGVSPVLEFLKYSDDKIKKKSERDIFRSFPSNLCKQKKPAGKPTRKGGVKVTKEHFIIERYRQFYEFRIKVSKKVVRIIFCERDDNIVLLHAFYKHDKRDTEKALEYSIKLYEKLETDSLLPFQYLKEVMMGCVGL